MSKTTAVRDETFLNNDEAAKLMGISGGTLNNWRASKDPRRPRAHRSGSRVRYKLSVIEKWIEDNAEDDYPPTDGPRVTDRPAFTNTSQCLRGKYGLNTRRGGAW